MPACIDCGLRFDPAIFGQAPAACPHCGRLLSTDAGRKWHDAARVANLAEAGYLVNLLGTEGVTARIFEDRSFNAIAGAWEQAYVIKVPADEIGGAAKLLRHEAAAAATEEYDAAENLRGGEAENLVFWRPVALMAIAGVASFVVGQRFAAESEDQHPRPYAESLVAAMEQLGRPLVAEQRGEVSQHRFIFHRQRQVWYMQSDRNGDGHYETVREFRGRAGVER